MATIPNAPEHVEHQYQIPGDTNTANTARLQLKIGGMQCSFCTASITKAYSRTPGVDDVSVNLSHEEALITYEPKRVNPTQLRDILRDLGYTVRDADKVQSFEEAQRELRQERDRLVVAAIFTIVALTLMGFTWSGHPLRWGPFVVGGLALIEVFLVAWPILKMAWGSIRRGILNQHVLMEFAAFGGLVGGLIGFVTHAWLPGDFLMATVVIASYHILSGYTSMVVRAQSSEAVQRLLALQPPTARVVRADGREEELAIAEVRVGDRVRIRPGESVPVDGRVVEGRSAVNQSLVTGEPIPEEKETGDEVIGGSLNTTGTLLVEVTHIGEESFLAQVARHIQEARALKPGVLVLVDRLLAVFVPAVLIVSAAAFVLWVVAPWIVVGAPDWHRAAFALLAVLVMGYPCALGMATPLAMIRGNGLAAEKGILMRSGEAFQVFKDVRRVVFDKTGTLTEGKPQVVDVVPFADATGADVLRLAAAVEGASEHPLARAVVDAADEQMLDVPAAEDFASYPGQGVAAQVEGHPVLVGTRAFLTARGITVVDAEAALAVQEMRARTAVLVAREQTLIGIVAIADRIKPDAQATVARLRAGGIEPVLLTGDNARTAQAVAAEVGIREVRAEVLPQEKAAVVRELQGQGLRVAMVGDGINDAPALMQADVGIAMGSGTDIAMESADVILVGERVGAVLDAYTIGKRSYRKTVQNVALAFFFNGVGVPAAATGLVAPTWAMIAMASSVTIILANSYSGQFLAQARQRFGRGAPPTTPAEAVAPETPGGNPAEAPFAPSLTPATGDDPTGARRAEGENTGAKTDTLPR